jgi:hypothetical protein
MNPFEERNFIQPMGSAIMHSGCLGLFLFKGFFLQPVFGVESGLSSVDLDTGHWTFHASFIGGGRGVGRGGFIFLSANRRAQGALLLFLLS